MKKFLILLIAFTAYFGSSKAQKKFPMEQMVIDRKGDTICVCDIFKDQKPKLFFFWFTGCSGCKISLDQTLIKHYKEWENNYGVQIIAVSGDKEDKRKNAIEFFKKYPFDLYFDIESELFALMPEVPYRDRTIKAYPTLVYVDSDRSFKAIDAWDAKKIETVLKKYQNH